MKDLVQIIVGKPRVSFCWECGRKLWTHRYALMQVEGHERILHIQCAKDIKNGVREPAREGEE